MGPRGQCPELRSISRYFVILWFERRCNKQNTIAHLKSNDLAPPKLSAGYATGSFMHRHIHNCIAYLVQIKK